MNVQATNHFTPEIRAGELGVLERRIELIYLLLSTNAVRRAVQTFDAISNRSMDASRSIRSTLSAPRYSTRRRMMELQ